MKNIRYNILKSLGITSLMLLNYSILKAAIGDNCSNPNVITVNNTSHLNSINMSGLSAYYFAFTPSDSVVYFDVTTTTNLPSSIEIYLTNCSSDPILSSNLIIDTNSIEHLSLNAYNLNPSSTYILKLNQNGGNTVSSLNLISISLPIVGPGGPFCWPQPCTPLPGCSKVVNGSFETPVDLNLGILDQKIFKSFGWYAPTNNGNSNFNNADYYHILAHPLYQPPSTFLGNRTAKDLGNGTDAFAGLYSVNYNPSIPSTANFREWMTGSLTEGLIEGRRYRVKMYVSLSTLNPNSATCVPPGIKFVQNNNPSLTQTQLLAMTADIQSTTKLTKTGNWVEISGEYTAKGGEKYFIISNFQSLSQSIPTANINKRNDSYFFIDEVSVIDLDACCYNSIVIKDGWNVDNLLASPDFAPFVSGTTLNSPVPITVEGLFTINKNFTINNSALLCDKDAEINILAGKKLTANNSIFKVCGDDMWNGVKVNGSTAEIILLKSEINDAKKAINSINGGKFTVTSSTFNKNYYGIYVDTYPYQHQGTVKKSIFKSTSNLLTPYSGRAEAGIYVKDVGYLLTGSNYGINIGSSANSNDKNYFYGPGNGSTSGNLKPGINIGIKLVHSSARIYNNEFRDFILKNYIDTQFKAGIDIEGVTDLFAHGFLYFPKIQIGNPYPNEKNYFYNSTAGINGIDIFEVVVNKNTFDMGAYSTLSGSYAIKFFNNYGNHNTDNIIINNIIKGVEKGVVLEELREVDQLQVNNNYIELNNSANNIGIYADYVYDIDGFEMKDNTITQCTRGIFIRDANPHTISKNNIVLNPTIYASTSNIGININNSADGILSNNTISSTNTTTNTKVYGINISSQYGVPIIECNDISKTGTAMSFNGISNSLPKNSEINGNQMYLNHNCMVLTNNTILGDIGRVNRASDNKWSSNNTGYHTYTYGANGNFSPLWTRGGGLPYEPTFNGSNFPGNDVDIRTNAIGTVLDCGGVQPCPGCFVAQSGNIALPAFNSLYTNDTAKWLAQYQYYVALANDSLIVNKAVQAFKDSMKLSAVGKMLNFKNNLSTSINSKTSLMAVNPSNLQENKLKTVLELKYDALNNSWDTIPSRAFTVLNSIAAECPFIEGPAVYEARALVNQYLNIGYNNSCEDYTTLTPKSKRLKNSAGMNEERVINVYPNPAKEIFNISIVLNSKENAQLILLDMNGRILKNSILTNGNNELNIEDLSSGIYFYQISIDENLQQTDKLIIH